MSEIWLDPQGRRHRARPCVLEGLLLMEAVDDDLVPEVVDPQKPGKWRRVE